MLKKINATGNPGCTFFNSECTISVGNTLRIGAGEGRGEQRIGRARLEYLSNGPRVPSYAAVEHL